jgi:hypothetical protein
VKPPKWWLRWRPFKTAARRGQKFVAFSRRSIAEISTVFLLSCKKHRNSEKQPFERLRRERFYLSPLIEATLCGVLEGEAIFGNSPGKARLARRIGVKLGEVVTFPPAPATGRVERHFALTGRGKSGKHVGTAASPARC